MPILNRQKIHATLNHKIKKKTNELYSCKVRQKHNKIHIVQPIEFFQPPINTILLGMQPTKNAYRTGAKRIKWITKTKQDLIC